MPLATLLLTLALRSPKDSEQQQPRLEVAQSATLSWTFPVPWQTPDLVFNVYYSDSLNVPLRQWKALQPVPGKLRSTPVKTLVPQRFFTVTASNYLGESDPATR